MKETQLPNYYYIDFSLHWNWIRNIFCCHFHNCNKYRYWHKQNMERKLKVFTAGTSANYWYRYRSCLCLIILFVGTRKLFFLHVKINFSSPQNKCHSSNFFSLLISIRLIIGYWGTRKLFSEVKNHRSCLRLITCFGGTRKLFLTTGNHFFSPKNKLSDKKKTYTDISNG